MEIKVSRFQTLQGGNQIVAKVCNRTPRHTLLHDTSFMLYSLLYTFENN